MKLMEEQLTPTPSAPAQPALEIPEKKKINWKMILGITGGMVVVLGIGIGIGMLLKNYQKPTAYVTASPTPTPTSDPTANRKTYTNIAGEYSIRVPNEWEIESNHFGLVTAIPPDQADSCPFCTQVEIVATEGAGGSLTFKTQTEFDTLLKQKIITAKGSRLYKLRTTKVDGSEAIEFVNQTLPGDPTESSYSKIVWVRRSNLNYFIKVFGTNEADVSKYLGTFYQILSTFKFLPKECGICPVYTDFPPNFCKDGVIISPGEDKCGCPLPPECKK